MLQKYGISVEFGQEPKKLWRTIFQTKLGCSKIFLFLKNVLILQFFFGDFEFSNPNFFVIFGFSIKKLFFSHGNLLLNPEKNLGVHSTNINKIML